MPPFDAFVERISRLTYEPNSADAARLMTDLEFLDWCETEAADMGAPQVLSDAFEELSKDERQVEMLLRAVIAGTTTTPTKLLRSAMWRIAAADAVLKADACRLVESFQRPLREALDHYDTIGEDRRALARESK